MMTLFDHHREFLSDLKNGLVLVTIQNKEADFTLYTEDENVYLQMLQPAKPVAAGNNNTSPAFPGNTIGFFNSISPIETKFQQQQ